MKKTIALIFLFALLCSVPAKAYYIKSFDSEVRLNKDGSFGVTERIVVDFGNEQRHGIYRSIPYKYNLALRKYRVRIEVLDVADDSGNRYQKSVSRKGDYVVIKIGSPDFTISGVMVYKIVYLVENAILYFEDHDELYWNVTGEEWPCDILSASATVFLPAGMQVEKTKATCFTGAYGSEQKDCFSRSELGRVNFESSRSLGVNEGLSIGLAMPKGFLKKPGLGKFIAWYLVDLWPILFLPIGIIFILFRYYKRGRDPIQLSIAPRYEPPEGLTPAEAGALVDETVDMRDMTSTIVDLAVRGYLKIIELEKQKILFFKNKDYALIQLKEVDDNLKTHERKMLVGLFSKGSVMPEDEAKISKLCPECSGRKAITVSSLKEKFYTELPAIKDAIYDSLVDTGLLPARPDRVRSGYIIFGSLLLFGAFILASIFFNWAFIAGLAPVGLTILFFAKYMPRKTKEGTIKAVHVAGFEEFVRRVEKDRIEKMADKDPTIFERLLPFAMALGVADQWAEAFEGIFKEAPSWFVSSQGTAFYPNMFVGNLGNAISAVGSTMSSRPRSSGASGGHSSFGGGGFSGGGFGGGGGKAW